MRGNKNGVSKNERLDDTEADDGDAFREEEESTLVGQSKSRLLYFGLGCVCCLLVIAAVALFLIFGRKDDDSTTKSAMATTSPPSMSPTEALLFCTETAVIAVADTTLRNGMLSNKTLGSQDILELQNGVEADENAIVLLEFDLQALDPSESHRLILRLHYFMGETALVAVSRIEDSSILNVELETWDSYDPQGNIDGPVLATFQQGHIVEVDVTDLVKPVLAVRGRNLRHLQEATTILLQLETTDDSLQMEFRSREFDGDDSAPKIVQRLQAPEPVSTPVPTIACPTPEPTVSSVCPTPEPVVCPVPEPAPVAICPTPNQVQLIPATAGDDCVNHYPLTIGGDPVIGSTINATGETRQGDVHYSFVGNGRHVKISTCFEETTTAHNFLLRNGNCGSQEFGETGGDPECQWNAGAAAFEFDTLDGRLYPIIVYPRGETEGQFAIQVTDFINPSNDYCANSVSLAINGDPVVGSTVNATDEGMTDDVYYSFVGNGRHVKISTCFEETTTAHNFLIRNGNCGSQVFGDTGNDPNCASNAGAAAFEFDTIDGRTYPILVYPRNDGNQGQFAIQVTDFINPSNDYCANSVSLAINGDPVVGSTVNATDEGMTDDVYCSFVGNGRHVKISTCFEETTTAHNFLIRNGNCGSQVFGDTGNDPNCASNSDAAAYEFDTVAGRTYPILVYPRNDGSQGQFAIQVTDFINPSNDYCANSVSLAINGDPVVGSTVNATDEGMTDDVYYSFVGNGRHVKISTCFEETTTAHNFLIRNGNCGSQVFGDTGNDPNCASNADAAAYEFDTVAGRTYPILVYPRNDGSQGQFAMQVTDFINPSNDYCANSVSLAINGDPVVGSTVNATDEAMTDDVYYSFVGTGNRVRISTCFDETTTAHNFLLRNGNCGSQAFGETGNDPNCASNAGAAAYEFDTVDGSTYPIIVYPRIDGSQGAFAIQVTSVEE